jgi:hypothetical protein
MCMRVFVQMQAMVWRKEGGGGGERKEQLRSIISRCDGQGQWSVVGRGQVKQSSVVSSFLLPLSLAIGGVLESCRQAW